jgi:hypothetical protein
MASGDGANNTADPQSWNRYSYAVEDPVNRYDPSGLNAPFPGSDDGFGGIYWGGIGSYQYWNGEYWQTFYGPVAFAMGGGGGGGGSPSRSVNPRQLMSDRLAKFDETNCAKVFGDLGIDPAAYKAGANTKMVDVRSAKMQERTVASVVGGRNFTTLGEYLGGADAAVARGAQGTAILLGIEFYGVNLDTLTPAEWSEYQKLKGSTLLHELLHVYSATFDDDYILGNWANQMFVGGKAPGQGGSRWISIWSNNDCQKVDPSKPGVFW